MSRYVKLHACRSRADPARARQPPCTLAGSRCSAWPPFRLSATQTQAIFSLGMRRMWNVASASEHGQWARSPVPARPAGELAHPPELIGRGPRRVLKRSARARYVSVGVIMLRLCLRSVGSTSQVCEADEGARCAWRDGSGQASVPPWAVARHGTARHGGTTAERGPGLGEDKLNVPPD